MNVTIKAVRNIILMNKLNGLMICSIIFFICYIFKSKKKETKSNYMGKHVARETIPHKEI